MDYDDKDFQSQNLYLAGEGSTKFPPVLRSYALPKFDFDESLQGNLRFDSLVETEVFLGIESNEDNQWIDAFSRGGSGIEFSTTAAESCSISRHDNVWSEATSSESVEMLLKSVGQEDYIPRQTVIQESDACDELACLARKMDPNPKPDDKKEIKDDVKNLLPPAVLHDNLSGLKEDVGMDHSQAAVPQGHEVELSVDGSSGNLELNICRNIDLVVSEGSLGLFTGDKSNNTNQSEVETVVDESPGDKNQDDPSSSGVQTNITEKSMQHVNDEKQCPLQTETNKQDLESSMMNKDVVDAQTQDGNAVGGYACHPDKSLCSIPIEALEGGSVVEGLKTGTHSLEESFGMEFVAVSDLLKAERCSEDICFKDLSRDRASEDVFLLKDEVDDQSALKLRDLPRVSIKDDIVSKGQVVEDSNSNCGICPNLQQNEDVVEKTHGEDSVSKENELLETGDHMDKEILSSKSESSIFTAEENSISNISEGNSDNKVGGFSSFNLVASSTKSPTLFESTQICENIEPDRQSGHKFFDQHVSLDDQESTRIHSDSSQIHCDVDQSLLVDKGAGSSSVTAGSVETELTTSTVSINVAPVNSSASQVISENISLASCEIIDIPPPSIKDVSTHEITGHNDFQRINPVVCSSIDEKEESAAKMAEKAGISTSVGSSEQETAPCPVTLTEKHHSSDTSGQLLCETVNDCLHNVGTSGTLKIDEPQGSPDVKVFQECTKEIGISPVSCDLTEKQSDGIVVSLIKDDKETLQENHDKSSSKILGDDILLGNKGSTSSAPLPDSSVELQEIGSFPVNNTSTPSSTFGSHTHIGEDQNQVKASSNQKPQVPEFIQSGAKNMLSAVQDPKENNTSKDERSLPPEVNPVADLSRKDVADMNTEDVSKRQSVLVATANKESKAVEGTPSTSGLGPPKTKSAGNISHGTPQISDREVTPSVSKATPERKTRRASNKTAGKESSRKGSRVKETTPTRQSKRVDKSTNLSLSPSPGFQMVQSNEVQQYGHIDSNSSKPFALVSASTSSIPDLNTSASSPVLFHQPFTDLQQVQLRAQIFVYGALIQGMVPDEAHMISAFGGPDGGRSFWENTWRACMERQHSQRSHPINPETPLQSRSGARASDSAAKQSAVQGKATSSPLGQSSSKATPTFVNPLIPLSSPLWNLPTPSRDSLQSSAIGRGSVVDYPQAHTSLHPYQTPPLRNFLGHNTSWISQSSIRAPWIPSPTLAPDNRSHLLASTVSDTIKFSSVKESTLPPPSGVKNVTPGLPTSSAGLQSITVGTASPLDANIVTVSPSQQSLNPKPKKRKKVMVSEDLGQKASQSLTPVSNMSTSVAIVTPVSNVLINTAEKSVVSVSPLADHLKGDLSVEKKILSDESLMKVKEARVHAEEASACSTDALNHSLEIWNQLDKHKSSGLASDIEAKLASAAVAVAAAAAVAKAAAAAANVASNAAIQAKLMAEEALVSSGYENSSLSNKISLSEGISNFGKATPASILKGADGTNSPGSIIGAAKEAVRRRVEAASAVPKRAENIDAVVKAAELAAEAVSQAGKIVTMGDPLPLCDLVEAGPEGFWKGAQESSHQVGSLNGMTRDLLNISNVRDIPEASHTHNRDISSGVISTSININEKNFRGPKGHKISDLIKPVDMVPESEPEIQASLSVRSGSENPEATNIKEGSLVEVFKDEEGFKAAWFTANILTLNDDKVYVCYTSLVAVEGAGPLKEWVSLEVEGDKPPRIRTTRPLTSLHYEGTRKRRRAAMGDYAWSVGDRVDAWIQESWKEGVITEKNKKDETTLTVHFPASGETSVVRAWHLRPSLIWKDGKWIEFSKVGVNDTCTRQGDTPNEKRPKLGSPAVEVKGKDKISRSVDAVESANPDERRLLNLTENDKVFNIGKSIKNDNKPDTQRMARSGLQKEESRVIFGVPKPGKKRKFMEVSKHYVEHGSCKTDDRNDSVKLANFLMPQSSGSRVWKNSSQNDSQEKPADFKPQPFKSGKPKSAAGRVIPPKDSSSNAFSLTTDLTGHAERMKDPLNHFKSAPQNESRQVGRAPYSATDGTTDRPILFSSRATSTDALPPKRAPTSRASKGKLAPAGGKFGKGEAEKAINDNPIKSTSDVNVTEPRRSVRRIQPTSRLLEGLQSSLIISKIPSVSNNRNPSKGNNQG